VPVDLQRRHEDVDHPHADQQHERDPLEHYRAAQLGLPEDGLKCIL
jgi:hypothetical protein